MRRYIVGDFETASFCDLKKSGGWRYSEDPTTEIFCFNWWDDGHYHCWHPGLLRGSRDYDRLHRLSSDEEVLFVAHNAAFEKAIWRNIMVPVFGFPDIPDERWHDTMAVCAEKAIPLKLEKAADNLRLGIKKDMAGSAFTIKLSKPNKKGWLDRSPESLQRVYTYCDTDVKAELLLHRRVKWQEPEERKVWLLDQKINQRGVRLDMDYVRAAQTIVTKSIEPLTKEFGQITGVKSGSPKFKAWLADRGVPVENLQKQTIADLLGHDETGEDQGDFDLTNILPDDVRRALEIRQVIGSASVKKLSAMEACVCFDGRARGSMQYHAAGTGRWGGRLFQPQNFPKPTLKDVVPDKIVSAILTEDPAHVSATFGCDPIEAVVSSLRHAIIAEPDHVLSVGDFAGIEARVVLALAGQHDKCKLLADGADPYCDAASGVYNRTITKADKDERQLGKGIVLGCGFQMGWRKFKLRYAPHLSDELCQEAIRVYREEWAPLVPKLWRALNDAAVATVWSRRPHEAYGVAYRLEDGWLTARLPSGRKLWYWNPQPAQKPLPWDPEKIQKTFTYQAYKAGRMKTIYAYGGLLTENVVQALARDLLVYAMLLSEAEGLPIIASVHDEIIAEPEAWMTSGNNMLEQIMTTRPAWAVEMGIPIAVECWIGERYRK